ncbi:NAD(P)-dependent oxidoreductase [Negadavirga shengliensis]|uniref:Saccharopine dehydrogenase [NAD(+), L-lysine-forming] n=1 Tax=Negadavirga shengliensis TaxID=1389218 RepID=A0ABV9SWA2_9BACT
MKIGLIREEKLPPDKRVAFSPRQLFQLQEYYENRVSFKVEPSPIRCYSDEEYEAKGIEVTEDVSDCEVLMGIKEVPTEKLIPDKTYFFFSHTVKGQVYNRKILQEVLKKNIRLIDYEMLHLTDGRRAAGFGRWAGIVGGYNSLWAYGKKSGLYSLRRAFQCRDSAELFEELKKVELPPIKLVITGDGKVATGVLEILEALKIRRTLPEDYLQRYFEESVYTQLGVEEYNQRRTDGGFNKGEFFRHPERYEGCFLPYAEVSDILIAAAYWDPKAPRLFQMEDISNPDFCLSVISDITCDINGSVPTTIRPSTIHDPVYDIDRESFSELPAFGRQNSISVVAIDNLPCELPRDASEDFGRQLSESVIPELLKGDAEMIENATIADNGLLKPAFQYLADYVRGI